MISFYLDFISSGHGQRDIDEPTSFDGAEFIIEQDEGRLGRDISGVAGSASKLRFDAMPSHCLDILNFNYEKFGFEAVVKFGVRIDEDRTLIGQIDFNTYQSDGVSYCEFTITEIGERALIKRRNDVKTDLFSYTTLDDTPIDPVQTKNVLLKAKPIIVQSKWNLPTYPREIFSDSETGEYFNPVKSVQAYDIKDTLSWLLDFDEDSSEDFKHVQAKTNLKNVKVDVNHNVEWFYMPNEVGSNKRGVLRVRIYWGTSIEDALENDTYVNLWEGLLQGGSDQSQVLPTSLSYTIPFVNNTEFIWVSYTIGSINSVNKMVFGESTTTMTATSIAYNTVVPMVRLIDAMKYNVKSASGLDITAPRWDLGGEFYDQWITTQALMRNLVDKPFNLSFKDIVEEYLPEVNGDYQLQEDGKVFFGIEPDFYRDFLMESFTNEQLTNDFGQPQGQIDEFVKSVNQRLSINTFKLSYKNYSSQRENEQANTYDLVHGSTEWLLKNMLVNGSKDVQIGFIRDAFLIEEARRKAYDLSDKTATQDDDKVYILDVVPLEASDRFFTETAPLQHRAPEANRLVLKNQETFSWVLLGIIPGSTFSIANGVNTGSYLVISVTDVELTLLATNDPENIDDLNTTFTYFIMPGVADLTIRTNEGFDLIQNIEDGENYGNLVFTAKRNTVNYYGSFLASCLLRTENKVIKNTLYKNNPEAITQYEGGDIITEGAEFTPASPILDIDMVKVTLLMTLNKFLELRTKVRQDNGYILTFDANGLPVKGYIKKGVFTFISKGHYNPNDILGQMEADLEVKYEPVLMEIFGTGNNAITINGSLSATDFDYTIDEFEKLHIFDQNGKRMYVPVPYNRVKVNNAQQAESVFVLIQWLNALKS